MTSSVGLAVTIALLSGAPAVGSPSVGLRVERSARADDCPDEAALRAMVEQIVRHAIAAAGPTTPDPDVRADVMFSRADAAYEATLQLGGAKQGERTLTDTGPTCVALGRAVAITLALSLEGELSVPAAPAPPPPAPRARRTAGFIGLTEGAALGLVGDATVATGADLGLVLMPRLWMQVGGQYFLPRSSALDPGSVRVSLRAGLVRLCGVMAGAAGPLQLAGCLEGVAGLLRGEGVGYQTPKTADSTWWGAGGGLTTRRRFGERWLVDLGLDALAPLRQYTFSVENRGVAYRSNAVSWGAHVGVALRIW